MKKILIILLVISVAFTGCATKKIKNKNVDASKNVKKIDVCLLIAKSGINDESFNQCVWEGMQKYAKDFKLSSENLKYAQALSKEDYVKSLSIFADEKPSLIVASGYYFKKPIEIVSKKYPKQKYLLIDNVANSKNVLSVTFKVEEASYIAGIIAAMKSKEKNYKKIGFIGGIDKPVNRAFEAGFEAGVKEIDKNLELLVYYANDFTNPAKGQKLAKKMYDKGVNIIFSAASSTGNGVIKEARRRAKKGEDVWIIGVDKDQYKCGIYDSNKSVILTSVLKRLDIAVYDTMKSVANGKFKAGSKKYALKNNGVSLPNKNPNLKKEWLKTAMEYKNKIIQGKVKVPLEPKRIIKKDRK